MDWTTIATNCIVGALTVPALIWTTRKWFEERGVWEARLLAEREICKTCPAKAQYDRIVELAIKRMETTNG